MRQLTILFVLVILFAGSKVSAQSTSMFFENQNIISKHELIPVLKMQFQNMPADKKIGFNVFYLVSPEWAEGIVGMTYKPENVFDVLDLTLGAGIETDDIPLRTQAGFFLKEGKFSSVGVLEYGGSGYWYLFIPQFEVSHTMKFGLHAERFVGIGPRVEFGSEHAAGWLSPTYDGEEKEWKFSVGMFVFL